MHWAISTSSEHPTWRGSVYDPKLKSFVAVLKGTLLMRELVRIILLFALVMRGVVPVGFMPAASADGRGLTLVICSGGSSFDAVRRDADGTPSPSKPDKTAHEPCAFASHGALIAPEVQHDRPAVTAVSQPLLLSATGTLLLARVGPPVGSRAPPFHS